MKNGTSFIRVVPKVDVDPSVWDSHVYAHGVTQQPPLREFVHAMKANRLRNAAVTALAPWAAIEYRHVPPSSYGTFALELSKDGRTHPRVGGRCLLFGTMRAYLGNVLVTPDPAWIGLPSGTTFQVKSEFLVIQPLDGLVYYWSALLRSPAFLRRLPPGGGGTRPRLDAQGLLRLPVEPIDLAARVELDKTLLDLAEKEWRLQTARRQALLQANL